MKPVMFPQVQMGKLRLKEEQPLNHHSAQSQVLGSFLCISPPPSFQRPQ